VESHDALAGTCCALTRRSQLPADAETITLNWSATVPPGTTGAEYIAEWDPTEHAAIRAAPAAIRDKIADAEDWLRGAISELDDLERELREQARSYRGRLNELRRQIDEVLDGEDTREAHGNRRVFYRSAPESDPPRVWQC
jgi:hypothetical protein